MISSTSSSIICLNPSTGPGGSDQTPSGRIGGGNLSRARHAALLIGLGISVSITFLRYQAGKRETISATDAGLFENVLQVDLDGTGPDAEIAPDLAVLQALLHQFHYLL